MKVEEYIIYLLSDDKIEVDVFILAKFIHKFEVNLDYRKYKNKKLNQSILCFSIF